MPILRNTTYKFSDHWPLCHCISERGGGGDKVTPPLTSQKYSIPRGSSVRLTAAAFTTSSSSKLTTQQPTKVPVVVIPKTAAVVSLYVWHTFCLDGLGWDVLPEKGEIAIAGSSSLGRRDTLLPNGKAVLFVV
jgi:hypothetical protein